MNAQPYVRGRARSLLIAALLLVIGALLLVDSPPKIAKNVMPLFTGAREPRPHGVWGARRAG